MCLEMLLEGVQRSRRLNVNLALVFVALFFAYVVGFLCVVV